MGRKRKRDRVRQHYTQACKKSGKQIYRKKKRWRERGGGGEREKGGGEGRDSFISRHATRQN